MQINCLHPIIILNPLAHELIGRFGNYTINGVETKLYKFSNFSYGQKVKGIHPSSRQIRQSDIDNCFITDYSTMRTYPLYLAVPCNHCDACKNAKVNAFVHRCQLETQLYDYPPLFLTLTYDDKHKKECGLCVRDFQLFLKRLRQNLVRQGFREKIRYALVGEYGKRSARAHGHAILWNLPFRDIQTYRRIGEIIKKSWSNGFVMYRQIDTRNDKAFYYTAKYLRKDCNVPEGCNPTFMVSSNRGGGIGSAFIDRIAPHVRRTLNVFPKFVNKWTNKSSEVCLNRYILNRLFPTCSRGVHSSVVVAAKTFVIDYQILKQRNYDVHPFTSSFNRTMSYFDNVFYLPRLSTGYLSPSERKDTKELISECLHAQIVLENSFRKGHAFYEGVKKIADLRDKFLEKLFFQTEEIPANVIAEKARIAAWRAAVVADRQIL